MLYPAGSILVIDSSPFGRCLFSLPGINVVRAAYPHSRLVAAAPTGICELLTASRAVDSTVDLGLIPPADRHLGGGVRRAVKLFKGVRRIDFDVVLDFSPGIGTQLFSFKPFGARIITPFGFQGLVEEVVSNIVRGKSSVNRVERHATVLRQLGLDIPADWMFGVMPSHGDNNRFEQLLERRGFRGGEPVVVLYSSRVHPPHGWPADRFADLARRLAGNFGARIVAADEPRDRSFTASLGRSLPQGSVELSEPGAAELLAAVARASVLVTDEPALAQVALELKTPALEIVESAPGGGGGGYRFVKGQTRSSVPIEDVYGAACEMLQASRSQSLFG